MKTIFLDCDGVLNNDETLENHYDKYKNNKNIDSLMVSRLNKIIEATGAKVVLSSSWRIVVGLEETVETMEKAGFIGEVIGATPNLQRGFHVAGTTPRGDEIQQWLDKNPQVTNFVILDDCDDMGKLSRYLVQTKFYSSYYVPGGLLESHVEKAIATLNGDKNEWK